MEITMRDRMLAVLKGIEKDRIPFVIYDGMFPLEDLYKTLGKGHFGRLKWSSVHKVIHPNCRFETQQFFVKGNKKQRIYLHTPIGSIYEERAFEPAFDSSSIQKHFIQEKKDYQILWYYLNDCQILEDYETFYQDQSSLGDEGIPLVAVERTPYQQLWIQWVGLQDLSYHFSDYSEEVEQTIDILIKRARKIFKIAESSPTILVDFPDNITSLAIGPKRFRQYCVPLYDELSDQLADRNIPVFVHMDGDLKVLWNDIANSKISGLDSFSPAPDNDTTVEDAVRMFPGKILYINFPSSIHLRPYDAVRAEAEYIIKKTQHTQKVQIQISENVPLNIWKTSFRAIIDAIEGR